MPALFEKIPLALAKWRDFSSRSPLRKLGHTSLVAASTSLVAKGFGFLKEIAVASYFGLSDGLDVYLMAFVLIGFPLSVLLNAVQTALVSSLAPTGRTVAEEGRLYISTAALTLLTLAMLLPGWLVLLHFALPLIASGFPPFKQQWLASALMWLIPYYLLNGLNLLAYGVLQAKRRFLPNGLLPALTPAVTILVVLAWGRSGGWEALAVALVVGTALESAILHLGFFRIGMFARVGGLIQDDLKHVVRGSMGLLLGTALLAMGPMIEQAIAASLGSGTNAALSYGYKLPAALSGILVTAIGITVLPYFAAMLAQNEKAYCLHSLKKLARWLMLGGLVLAIPLATFSDTIVTLLYQRNAFDAAATARVSPVQLAYFLQLPFALIAMLGVRTLVALGRNGIVSILFGVATITQAGLAFWWGTTFGAVGIAWAATLVSVLLATSSFLWAHGILRVQAI